MNAVRILMILAALVVFSGCVSNVATDYDPTYDFTAYRTYHWHQEAPQPGDALAANPLARRRVVEAVDKALAEKGFRLVENEAGDFRVFVHGMVRDRVDVYDSGGFYFYGPFAFGSHRPYVNDYDEETLFVDVIDAETGQLAWRGSFCHALQSYDDPHKAQAAVDKIVRQILKDFPPMQN